MFETLRKKIANRLPASRRYLTKQIKGLEGQLEIVKAECNECMKANKIRMEDIEQVCANSLNELVWANVFHDTIIDSKWLKDQSFSPGRAAVG